jgi:hypothetical protein
MAGRKIDRKVGINFAFQVVRIDGPAELTEKIVSPVPL